MTGMKTLIEMVDQSRDRNPRHSHTDLKCLNKADILGHTVDRIGETDYPRKLFKFAKSNKQGALKVREFEKIQK